MLSKRVDDNSRRVDELDQTGTRGVGALAVQITEVIKDVSEMRQTLDDHNKAHTAERRQLGIDRRWLVMAIIAALALVETPVLYLVFSRH